MTAEADAEDWAREHHESLPRVACVGVFDSGELKRAGSDIWSSMAFLWFQGEFALPIDPQVVGQIQSLDWESCAKDWSW